MSNTNINNIPHYLFNTGWNAAVAVSKVTAVIGTVTAGVTFGAPLVGLAAPAALIFNGWWCASFFAGTTATATARQVVSDFFHSKHVLEYTDYYSGGYGDQIADFLDIAFATGTHGVRNLGMHSFLFPGAPHLHAVLFGMLDGFLYSGKTILDKHSDKFLDNDMVDNCTTLEMLQDADSLIVEAITFGLQHGIENPVAFLIGGPIMGAAIDYLLSSSIGSHKKAIPFIYKNLSSVDKDILNKCFVKDDGGVKHKIECGELDDQPGHFECTEYIGYAYKLAQRKGLISDDYKDFIQKDNFQFHFNSSSYEENHNMSIAANITESHDHDEL